MSNYRILRELYELFLEAGVAQICLGSERLRAVRSCYARMYTESIIRFGGIWEDMGIYGSNISEVEEAKFFVCEI